MAAFIGKIPECDSIVDWNSYSEQLEQLFVANDTKEDKKVAILIASMGHTTYKLLRDLCLPKLPKDKSYGELVKILKEHLNPKPIASAERFRFFRVKQEENESAHTFIVRLKAATEYCEFEGSLNAYLRDQFVNGLPYDNIQRHLLTVKDLTFMRATEIALTMETASQEVQKVRETLDRTRASVCSVKSTSRSNSVATSNKSGQRKSWAGGNQASSSKWMNQKKRRQCFACGSEEHIRESCRFKDAVCHKCKKKGHIKSFCHAYGSYEASGNQESTSTSHSKSSTKRISMATQPAVFKVDRRDDEIVSPLIMKIRVGGVVMQFEVDCGSSVTIIDEHEFKNKLGEQVLDNTTIALQTYLGERLDLRGSLKVKAIFGKREHDLRLFVVRGRRDAIVGRDWLDAFGILGQLAELCNNESVGIHRVVSSLYPAQEELDQILKRHEALFREEMGFCKNVQLSIPIDRDFTPIFLPARNPPLALRAKMNAEIDRLVRGEVLVTVTFSNWATPVTPVEKKDGSVKLAGLYNLTVNKGLPQVSYPLPRFETIAHTLAGGRKFSTYDFADAYNQFGLDEESQKVMTINTHRGLYQVTRLFYGVACAPSLFQRAVEQLVKRVPKTQAFIDDICSTGKDDMEHLGIVDRLLTIFEDSGLRLKAKKCKFLQDSVQFLGHVFSCEGYAPIASKIDAVVEVDRPECVAQLRSYLGMVNYFSKFLPGLATVLEPLYGLLRKGITWTWSTEQEGAFSKVKELLKEASILVHFDPSRKTILTVDASPVGVGAVLAHEDTDGRRCPIAFASGVLNDAQKNYSQTQKEGFAVIFGVKRFHHYLYGYHFVLETDHKPLAAIYGEKRGTNEVIAARLQRWSIFLNAYNFTVKYIKGKDNVVADGLSRTASRKIDFDDEADVQLRSVFKLQRESLPISVSVLVQRTKEDKNLQRIKTWIANGWPRSDIDPEFLAYFRVRERLAVDNDCIYFSERVLIPEVLRRHVLTELHSGHQGMVKMKLLARSTVWWSGIDKHIEDFVRRCEPCQRNLPDPPKENEVVWPTPSEAWGRIHLDFAGPYRGHIFLLCVDAKSKWPDIAIMKRMTAKDTINVLKSWFSRNGLALHVHTDNGSQFTSQEFRDFLARNGIRHSCSPPYHPATNGAVEGFVRIFKSSISKLLTDFPNVKEALQQFLFTYRITPIPTLGKTPAEVFAQKKMRSRLDLLLPHTIDEWLIPTVRRKFRVKELIYARDHRSNTKWVSGEVMEELSPVTYLGLLHNGVIWKRHANQLRTRLATRGKMDDFIPVGEGESVDGRLPEEGGVNDTVVDVEETLAQPVGDNMVVRDRGNVVPGVANPALADQPNEGHVRRSHRFRKKPSYLRDFVP